MKSRKRTSRKSSKKCKSCKSCKMSSHGKCMCDKKSCKCLKLRLRKMFGVPVSATFLRGR